MQTEADQKQGTTNNQPDKSLLRRILIAGAIGSILTILLILLLPVLSPLYRPLLRNAIQNATGRKTTVGEISINLLQSRARLRKLNIYEEDDTTRFAGVKDIQADFNLLPLLSGKLSFPSVHVTGLSAHIRVDENGTANYQSILQRLQGTGAESAPSQNGEDSKGHASSGLPEVKSNIRIRQVEFTYDNSRNNRSARVRIPRTKIQIQGLKSISYKSSGAIRAKMKHKQPLKAQWAAAGQAGLVTDGRYLTVTSQGDLKMDDIRAPGSAIDPPGYQLKLTHDLAYTPAQSLRISSIDIQSQLFDMRAHDFKSADPMSLMSLLVPAGKSEGRLTTKKVSGHLSGTVYLPPTFRLIDHLGWVDGMEQSTGELSYKFQLRGSTPSQVQLSAAVTSSGMHLRRSSASAPNLEPLDFRLSSLAYNMQSKINLQTLSWRGTHTFQVAGRNPQKKLLTVDQIWDFNNIRSVSEGRLPLNSFESDIKINLSELGNSLRGLFPETTRLTGFINNRDSVQKSENGFSITGDTMIRGELNSHATGSSVPLELRGERNIRIGLTTNQSIKNVTVKKLRFETPDDDFLSLIASGELTPLGADKSRLSGSLNANLARAQPYLNAFGFGYEPDGTVNQKWTVETRPSTLSLKTSGKLHDFAMAHQKSEQSIQLGSSQWHANINVHLDDETWERVVFAPSTAEPCEFRMPGLTTTLSGTVSRTGPRPYDCNLQNVQWDASGDLNNVPHSLLALLPTGDWGITDISPYQLRTQINGPLKKLSIHQNAQITPRVGRQSDQSNGKTTLWAAPCSGETAITVTGLPQFMQSSQRSSLNVHFADDPSKSVYRIGNPNNPAVTVHPSGTVGLKQDGLRFSDFKALCAIYGQPLNKHVTAPLLEAADWKSSRCHLDGMGKMDISLDGQLGGNMTGNYRMDYADLSARINSTDGSGLISKAADTPLSASCSFAFGPDKGAWNISFDPFTMTFADFNVTAHGNATASTRENWPHIKLSGQINSSDLQSVWDTVPAVQHLNLKGGKVDVKLSDLEMTPSGQVGGSISGHTRVGSLSIVQLPELINKFIDHSPGPPATRNNSPEGVPAKKPSAPCPQTGSNPSFADFQSDLRFSVNRLELGPNDILSKFNCRIHSPSQNQLKAELEGIINSNSAKEGQLNVSGKGRISEQPPIFDTNYKIKRFPITQPMLEIGRLFALFGSQVDLLESVSFSSTEDFVVSTEGETSWRGTSWPMVQRTLTSSGPIPAKLPGGRIDISIDPQKVLQSDTVQKLLQGYLSALTGNLKDKVKRKQELSRRIEKLKGNLESLRSTVQNAQKQKKRIKDIIAKLKPLAMFSDDAEEKLEDFEDKLDKYGEDLKEGQRRIDSMLQKQKKLTKKKSDISSTIGEMRQKLDRKGDGAGDLGLDTDISFSFDAVRLELKIDNPAPWTGRGSKTKFADTPISTIKLADLYFLPKEKDYPRVTGALSLTGNYELTLKPSMKMLGDLGEDLPQVARYLHTNGLTWTNEGLQMMK